MKRKDGHSHPFLANVALKIVSGIRPDHHYQKIMPFAGALLAKDFVR
jgi:hypothetical protein